MSFPTFDGLLCEWMYRTGPTNLRFVRYHMTQALIVYNPHEYLHAH